MKYLSAAITGCLVRLASRTLWIIGCWLGGGLLAPAVQAQAPVWQSVQAVDGLSTFPVASTTGPGGFVFMVGYFTGTVAFGTTQLTSAGSLDIFVAKWNPSTRAFVWAQRAGGNASDEADGVAVQGSNVYVTGSFSSPTADFGPVTLTNANTLTVGNTSDAFLTKFVDAGTTSSFGWTQRFGGGNIEFGNAVDVVGINVYIGGHFTSPTATFGALTLVNSAATTSEGFVAKLIDAGTSAAFTWALPIAGNADEGVSALKATGSNVYLTGYFSSPGVTLGGTTLTNAGAPGSGSFHALVAKATDDGPMGRFVWAQAPAGNSSGFQALVLNGQSLYVVGTFSGTAQFGTTTLSSQGSNDVCVAKLADAGATGGFVWAQQAGGSARDLGYSLALSGTSVCVGGLVGGPGTSRFGSLALNNPQPMGLMGFVATLTDPTLTTTTAARLLLPAQLYPNPARCTTTLRLPSGTVPSPLVLTDALGRAVRHYPAPAGGEVALDLLGLPAGLYLLHGAGPARHLAVE